MLLHPINNFCPSNMTKRLHVFARFGPSQHASGLILRSSVHLFHPPLFFCQFSLHRRHRSGPAVCSLLPRSRTHCCVGWRRLAVAAASCWFPGGDEVCLVLFIYWLFHCFPPSCVQPKTLALTQVFNAAWPMRLRPVAITLLCTCSPAVWASPRL